MARSYVWEIPLEPLTDEFAIDNLRPDPVTAQCLGSFKS
jgi:hypothetical protein